LRGSYQSAQDGKCAKRESDSIDYWVVWEVCKKPRWQFGVGVWIMRLVLVAMSEEIKTNGNTANIFQ
jgi:hypothetical protein